MAKERTYRVQVDVSQNELRAIRDFQFTHRYPTQTAAVRELLRRGLADAEKESPPNPEFYSRGN